MVRNKIKLDPPIFIAQQDDFDAVLSDLKKERILAVDTEANSLYAYREQVCLIQISSSKNDYIIDPLSIDDISGMGGVFSDPDIEKVFHASEYDILILHDEYQFEFKNLFDTMLAAQILGRTKLGLDALLEDLFGIIVNKKYQRANWGKRPLDNDMLRYAQMDTHYLIQIRQFLWGELEKTGLSSIAQEDFSRACQAYKHIRENNEEPWWRLNGSKKLSPRKAAVLKQLYLFRDRVAQKKNLPVFKVLSSQSLLQLAEKCPKDIKQLSKLELPSKKAVQRYAEELIDVIHAGLNSEPIKPPKRVRLDNSYLAREKALRDWRKKTAKKMNVNSAVILPRELLYAVVKANPDSKKSLAKVLQDVPWRLERFGDDILSELKRTRRGE
jgi:ribonuclease D